MPRSTKPSFVLELPLIVDSKQDSELQSRFNAAMRLYNNVLGEAKTRMELVRNSEAYQAAKKIPRNQKKERAEAFNKARAAYRFTDYDLQAYANRAAKDSKWKTRKNRCSDSTEAGNSCIQGCGACFVRQSERCTFQGLHPVPVC